MEREGQVKSQMDKLRSSAIMKSIMNIRNITCAQSKPKPEDYVSQDLEDDPNIVFGGANEDNLDDVFSQADEMEFEPAEME